MLETIHEARVIPLGVGVGYYTVPDAARLLRTAPRNIARWLDGYSYRGADGNPMKTSPLWRTQFPRLGDALEIGFRDLIELRFVLAFVRQNVPLNVIRRCLENARAIRLRRAAILDSSISHRRREHLSRKPARGAACWPWR